MFGPSADAFIATDASNEAYWLSQSLQAGTVVFVANDPLGFSRVQLVWDRTTPVGTREDVLVTSLAFCQRAATTVTQLSNADKAVVETALIAWWTSMKAGTSNQYTLREFRWYDYQPISSRPGPVDRVTASGVVGGSAGARLPDQLAISQTFKTASRKHWGRWYLLNRGAGSIDTTYGRHASADVTQIQGFTRTLLQVSGGSGLIHPCVASIGYHGVMNIRELQTDNVDDVIRSRRAKVSSFKATNTS